MCVKAPAEKMGFKSGGFFSTSWQVRRRFLCISQSALHGDIGAVIPSNFEDVC